MKISERVVRFTLIFLIALSLFFSYNIWISPASKKSADPEASNVVADTKNYRKASDAFLPMRLVWTQNSVMRRTHSENMISDVQGKLAADVSRGLDLVVDENEKAFSRYEKMNNGVELLYEGNFLLSDYFSTFKFDISNEEEAEDFYFSRVQIDFDQRKVNFLDYAHKSIYQLNFTGDTDDYEKILSKKDVDFTTVTNGEALNEQQLNTEEMISLKKYSYILSTQSFTLFRNAFFQDPTNVDNDNVSVYTSGQERLEIDVDQQLADFQGELPINDDLDDVYQQSFSYVKKLGTSVGNIRYFDRTENQINYRVNVEGFPVFGDYSRGLVSVTLSNGSSKDTKSVHIQTSTNTIQVPIPADEVVELPKTEVVQEEILEAGAKPEKIKSILIGYTWQTVKETNRVVDLTPEWYILYDGEWYSEKDLIEKLPRLEVE